MIIENHRAFYKNGAIKIPEDAVPIDDRLIAWYRKAGSADWFVGEYVNNLLSVNGKDGEEYKIKYPKAGESDYCRRCKKPVNITNCSFYLCFEREVSKPLLVKEIIPLCDECKKIVSTDAEELIKFRKENKLWKRKKK